MRMKHICRLKRAAALSIVSIMIEELVDASRHTRISELAWHVINGGEISREDALWLFSMEDSADILDVMAGANRIREHFKGNKIHLCSIVNAKAGRLLGELQFLRAIGLSPDRLAQIRLR